jgi:elongation factor G
MVEGIDSEGHFQKVLARVPLSEMHDFSSSLRSITQGRAKFRMLFDSYQAMTPDMQRKLAEEYNKSAQEAVA